MSLQLKCSEHAKIRIKERMGITGKREVKDLTRNAFHKGLSMKKHYLPRNLLNWVDNKVNKKYHGRCSQFRIYNGNLFLFSKSLTLVTVIPVPKKLQPQKANYELIRYR